MCFGKCKDNCEVLLSPWFNVNFVIANAFTRPIDGSFTNFSISKHDGDFIEETRLLRHKENPRMARLATFWPRMEQMKLPVSEKGLALQVSPRVVQWLTDECLNSLILLFYSLSFLVFWIYWLLLLWLQIYISWNQTIAPLKCLMKAGKNERYQNRVLHCTTTLLCSKSFKYSYFVPFKSISKAFYELLNRLSKTFKRAKIRPGMTMTPRKTLICKVFLFILIFIFFFNF